MVVLKIGVKILKLKFDKKLDGRFGYKSRNIKKNSLT